MVAMARDLSSCMTTTEAEGWFRSLFDRAIFSVQIFDVDGYCVYANPAWSTIWGPPPETILGYNILADPQLQHGEQGSMIRRAFTGESLHIPPVYYDPQQTPGNPEGRGRWCAADASPIHDAMGNMAWVLLRHEDVTESIEQTVRENEWRELFEAAFEYSNDAIFLYDVQGRLFRINRQARDMFGFSSTHGDHASIYDIYPEEKREQSHLMIETVLNTERFRCETCMQRQDGSKFPGEISTTLIKHGDTVLIQSVIRDLSTVIEKRQQLQATSRRQNMLLETIPVATVVTRISDGALLYANSAGYALGGYDPESAACMSSNDVYVHSEDRQHLRHILKEQGKADGFESELRRADGSRFYASIYARYFEFDGESAILAVILDDTPRREAEKRTEASEQRFRQLFTLIPDAVGVHQNGRWEMLNPAALHIFGANSLSELIGTPVVDRVHPDHRELVIRRMQHEVVDGEPVPLMLEKLLRVDGSMFWGEVQGIPFVTEAGKFAVLVSMRDVSDRVQAEQNNAILRAAIECSPASMLLIGPRPDYRITYANKEAARIHARHVREMVGMHFYELHGNHHNEALDRAMATAMQQCKVWSGEVELFVQPDDGNRETNPEAKKILRRHIAPLFDKQEGVVRYLCIDMDVTGEKQEQKKLEHMQRLESLGVLAGGIAHDFNNLLTAIMGHAALARLRMTKEDPSYENLMVIEKTSHRAADLCRQMLAYSGRGKLVVKKTDLSALVAEIMGLLKVSIHKNVTIHYELADHLLTIEADQAQLQQVIMNLVINADEAIGEHPGNITIITGMMQAHSNYLRHHFVEEDDIPAGTYVFLEVTDTGCGMDEHIKKHLFEPFFTTKFTGRGLGMSAILGIVRGHRGAIKVTSKKGQGSTFRVLFPPIQPS